MEKHNYKLSGTGNTVKLAEQRLGDSRNQLVNKLKDNKVIAKLEIVRVEFSADYRKKQEKLADKNPTSFTQKSEVSWKDLREKAAKIAPLNLYDVAYAVNKYVNLTDEQLDASRARQSPAGPDEYKRVSSLDNLARL